MKTQYQAIKTYSDEHPLQTKIAACAGLVLVGFLIGAWTFAEPYEVEKVVTKEVVKQVRVPVEKVVTKTNTVYKAPAACQEFADIDNGIFTQMATALETFDFGPLADHVERVTPDRTAAYIDCVGSSL